MKWKADISFRFNDDFEKKPYFSFHRYNGVDLATGWLWFRWNVNVYRSYR